MIYNMINKIILFLNYYNNNSNNFENVLPGRGFGFGTGFGAIGFPFSPKI